MSETKRAKLETELERHYAAQRKVASGDAIDAIASAMVAEDTRMRRTQPCHMGVAEFVASQARYVPAWTWAAQAALVALMGVLACAVGDAGPTKVCVGILSAMCVLVGVPTVHASKLYGVAELEYACPRNAASVLVARLIVLGCSSALAVALMVGTTAPAVDASVFEVALWACPPFFLSCAGSLMVLRKASPSTSPMLCAALAAACSVVLLALASAVPDLYAHASLASWAAAAAAALAWLAHEVTMTLRAAREGLDAFSPHLARTYN